MLFSFQSFFLVCCPSNNLLSDAICSQVLFLSICSQQSRTINILLSNILYQLQMVCTHNKHIANYRAAKRNDGSKSAGAAMVHSIQHTRRVANSSATQTNEASGTAGDASQMTPIVEAPPIKPPKKRGRKPGSRTKFKEPPHGVKVALKPSGDK
jgi:hypothetical protein